MYCYVISCSSVEPRYHKYRSTTVRYLAKNSNFGQDFRAKNQFIDQVNKLEVFKYMCKRYFGAVGD